MGFIKQNQFGSMSISNDVITQIAGGAAVECYGVVGMASQKLFKDGFAELLKIDSYSKGIVITENDKMYSVDMYVFLGYGVKIGEVVNEIQKKVKYVLEQTLDIELDSVNVFVQGIKFID